MRLLRSEGSRRRSACSASRSTPGTERSWQPGRSAASAGAPNVIVAGDCAHAVDPLGRPYAATAQVAMQQGKYAAESLAAKLGHKPVERFRYRHRGTIASLGKRDAVGTVGKWAVHGLKAVWLKRLVESRYLYLIGGLPLVVRMLVK
jgi:NADH dehydrogenase